MEEGEAEGKRQGKEVGDMTVCSKRETLREQSERGARDAVEYVWRMWRTLYTPPGSLWGAFRLLVCNIRNSSLPVCRLLPVRDGSIGAGETRARAPCESGITCVGGVARRAKGAIGDICRA